MISRVMASSGALLLLTVLFGSLAGCGASNTPMAEDDFRKNNLLEVGELLRMYQMEKGKPPESLAEVEAVESLEMVAPMGLEPIRKGDVVVRWGAKLPDTGEEPGTTPEQDVLAYFKEVPDQGGPVLLLNRTVETMTADDFKAAPKAGKEPTPASAKGS